MPQNSAKKNMRGVSSSNVDKLKNIYNGSTINAYLIFHILHNPVSCGADGLLGDAHDAADAAVFQAHLVTSPPTYSRAS